MLTATEKAIILFQDGQGAPITLPPLFCPAVPAARSDQIEQAEAHSLQWAVTFQLVQPQSKQLARLTAARLAWIAGRINPDFRFDQLTLFTDWLTWLICYDDLCDGEALGRDPVAWGALIQRLMAAVEGSHKPAPTDALAYALADLGRRLRGRTSTRWLDRFAHDLKQTFQANRWEAALRADGTPPDLATYTKMRLLTSAIAPCLDLMAICAGVDPQAEWLSHAYLQQLEKMTSNHICWVNDLFGLAREIKENNPNNLVLVLQRERRLSLQAAVDQVAALCNAEMKAFLALADHFSTEEEGLTTGCQRYIQRLQNWMRGNLDWYAQTERYQAKPLVGVQLAACVRESARQPEKFRLL